MPSKSWCGSTLRADAVRCERVMPNSLEACEWDRNCRLRSVGELEREHESARPGIASVTSLVCVGHDRRLCGSDRVRADGSKLRMKPSTFALLLWYRIPIRITPTPMTVSAIGKAKESLKMSYER